MLNSEMQAQQPISLPKTNRSLKTIVKQSRGPPMSTATLAKKQLQYQNNRQHMSYFDKLKMMIGSNDKYSAGSANQQSNNILGKRVSTITEDSVSRSRSKRPASRLSLLPRKTAEKPERLGYPPLPKLNQSQEQAAQTQPVKNLLAKPYRLEMVNYGKSFQEMCEGVRVGALELSEVLGTGANANVRLGVDKSTNMRYAVKVYEKYRLIEPRKMKSVKRQIKLHRQLHHQNIISLLNAYQDRKQIHIIMQYFQPTTLQHYFRSHLYTLAQPTIKHIARQLLRAVDHMHNNSLAHRDIKPDNILIDSQGTIKLIDFGFATVTTNRAEVNCGTPNYMAPELHGKNCSYVPEKVDVWAIGVSLCYLIEGVFPFKGYDDKDLVRKVRAGEFVVKRGTQVFREFVEQCLAVDPEHRSSCSALLNHQWLNPS